MLSDRFNLFGLGYRKPYIIFGLIIQAACLIAVPLINAGQNFTTYALLAFVMMLGMALYDTCTDGLALDTTPTEEEGMIQGFMVGSRAAGVVVTSAVIGLLVQSISWFAGFVFLAGITLLPLPFAMSIKESERSPNTRFDWSAFKSFGQKHVIALAVFGALYSLIINGANQLVNPFLVAKFNIDISTAGYIATVVGLGTVTGGLVGGNIADTIGQKRSIQLAVTISLAGVGILPFIFSSWMAWLLVFIFGFSFGFYETIYFAMSMRLTDGRIAASMFAILMAVANIGTGIGLGLSGLLAEELGFPVTFFIFALLNLLAVPLIRLIFNRRQEAYSSVE